MLMNFEISDAPILAKQSFQGGRWKDRFVAKKVAQSQFAKTSRQPANREIFTKGRHEAAVEEYIGPSATERAPKRQRVEPESGRNASTAAIVSGKLPPGSINVAGSRTKIPEETRPAFVSGKLPPGSISTGGGRSTKFSEDPRPAFVSGKLPPGSINIGGGGSTKIPEETRPAFVSGKLPPGSIKSASREKPDHHEYTPASNSTKFSSDSGPGGRSKDVQTAGKPAQIISSLFSFNPAAKTKFEDPEEESEPAKPSNAPLTEEMETFVALGLSSRIAAHLSTKMDLKAPTAIQKAAIPQMVSDDSDAFIQAETGSGKTLAYLLPIVERIMAMSNDGAKVHRDSGLFAVVLAPTRELCTQIASVLERLLRCAPWIVGTTIIGGKGDGAKGTERSQKARIRKGVNILIATPGRLAYHLEHTEALKVHTVRWLVLDEGDRLMELGFEDTIKEIVDRIGRRTLMAEKTNGTEMIGLPKRRITVLCSATMKMNVQRLGEISLKDAVHIKVDPSEEDVEENAEGGEETEKAFSAPAQLKQAYAVVPAKLRLVTLAAILKRRFARRGTVMKAIVFISCADSVDFHFSLFSRLSLDAEKVAEKDQKLIKSELTKDTIAQATAFST